MPNVACFLIEPTNSYRAALRRYSLGQGCPGQKGYHDASVDIGTIEHDGTTKTLDAPALDDPRWPKKCDSCDHLFSDADYFQLFPEIIYAAPDGRRMTLREAPAGAMWRATWLEPDAPTSPDPEIHESLVDARMDWCGPDHKSYVVRLPDLHDWAIDGPSSQGGKWIRVGEAPNLSVTPSILTPKYHGFLTNGELVAC